MVAEGLRRALKPVIEEVTKSGGARAEREVAIVLRAWSGREARRRPDSRGGYQLPGLVVRVFQQSRLAEKAVRRERPLIVLP